MSWKIWTDVVRLYSWFYMENVLKRIVQVFWMADLFGFATKYAAELRR